VSATGGILEQAWMMKMAREVGRRVEEERRRKEAEGMRAKVAGERAAVEEDAPPAYAS
jgi:distribution and morphology protein 34